MSNKELAAEAVALGKKLGRDVVTQGLANDGLRQLVATLRDELGSKQSTATPDSPDSTASTETPPPPPRRTPETVNGAVNEDDENERPPAEAAAPPVVVHEYQVPPGKAFTCGRGMLVEGDEVRPTDVSGGVEQLEGLVASGLLLKKQQPSE